MRIRGQRSTRAGWLGTPAAGRFASRAGRAPDAAADAAMGRERTSKRTRREDAATVGRKKVRGRARAACLHEEQ